MKHCLNKYGIFVLIVFAAGCSTHEVRYKPGQNEIVFTEPYYFRYNFDLIQYLSEVMRTDLKIPGNIDDPEIALRSHTGVKKSEKNVLGVQYKVWEEKENTFKQIAEVNYGAIFDEIRKQYLDQNTFEATICNVTVHEILHAYYDYVYKDDPEYKEAKKDKKTGNFEHCKMDETGDLKKYTAIVDQYFKNNGIAQKESLRRVKDACAAGKEDKNELGEYKCLY